MEKKIILELETVDEGLLRRAASLGVTSLYVEPGKIPGSLRSGFKVYSEKPGGDFLVSGEPGKGEVVKVKVEEPGDIERVLAAARLGARAVIVETGAWKIIPLENLVADLQHTGTKLIARASGPSEVEALLGVLERGVDGVLLRVRDEGELEAAVEALRSVRRLELREAEVTEVRDVGMGERACVDTVSILGMGEGMLVGDTAGLFFLIHNEGIGSGFTSPRPFRVNAGAIHCYILAPDGSTKYLSELEAGSRVLAVSRDGAARPVAVGRVKIERRHLRLVKARAGEVEGSVILQNAETIRLVKPNGELVSVSELRPGDRVVVHVSKARARHFGKAVEEFVLEK